MTNDKQTISWKERLEIEIAGATTHINQLHKYTSAREKILKHCRETWFVDEESRIPLTDTRIRTHYNGDEEHLYNIVGRLVGLHRSELGIEMRLRRIKRESYAPLLKKAIERAKTETTLLTPKNFLEDLEYQLAEHLATPCTGTSIPPRIPYQASEITSEQLQEHLEEMEERNPSEGLNGEIK
jgi:hypothetical protein